jgi:P27 family predicted phage terminase small subunit
MAKLLTIADVETFGRYCRNFARWLKLQRELDTDGETYVSESQHGTLKRANPAFIMADRLERMLLATEDRFGLNPAERQRIMAARAQKPAAPATCSARPTSRRPTARTTRPARGRSGRAARRRRSDRLAHRPAELRMAAKRKWAEPERPLRSSAIRTPGGMPRRRLARRRLLV